jgi:hypothetical protein
MRKTIGRARTALCARRPSVSENAASGIGHDVGAKVLEAFKSHAVKSSGLHQHVSERVSCPSSGPASHKESSNAPVTVFSSASKVGRLRRPV